MWIDFEKAAKDLNNSSLVISHLHWKSVLKPTVVPPNSSCYCCTQECSSFIRHSADSAVSSQQSDCCRERGLITDHPVPHRVVPTVVVVRSTVPCTVYLRFSAECRVPTQCTGVSINNTLHSAESDCRAFEI